LKTDTKEKFRTAIGGQAVIEGIMMRGVDKAVVVVRTGEGLESKELPVGKPRPKKHILAWPFIRGLVGFVSSLSLGMKALNYSASMYAEDSVEETDETTEPGKFDKWFEKHEKAATGIITTIAMVLGFALAIGLFTLLPTLLGSQLVKLNFITNFWRGICEGVIRVIVFLCYLFLVSKLKDIQRVFSYHGAEHKTIACYEAGEELTVENVNSFTRFHPRCGTSFLLNVVIISILLFMWVPFDGYLIRIALRLALLPGVVMIAYEFNRWAGKHDGIVSRALRAPGLWLQRLTTNEPDVAMIEVGIKSLVAVLPDEKGTDEW